MIEAVDGLYVDQPASVLRYLKLATSYFFSRSVGYDDDRPLHPTKPATWSITWAWSRTCGKHAAGSGSLSTPRPVSAWRCTSGPWVCLHRQGGHLLTMS